MVNFLVNYWARCALLVDTGLKLFDSQRREAAAFLGLSSPGKSLTGVRITYRELSRTLNIGRGRGRGRGGGEI